MIDIIKNGLEKAGFKRPAFLLNIVALALKRWFFKWGKFDIAE